MKSIKSELLALKFEPGKKVGSKLRFMSKELQDRVISLHPSKRLIEGVYLILTGENPKPCKCCGKDTKFGSFTDPYPHEYCSQKCKAKCLGRISYETRKDKLSSEYGVENTFQLSESIEKSKKTKFERYDGYHSKDGIERIRKSNDLRMTALLESAASTRRKNFKSKFIETLKPLNLELISNEDELKIRNSRIHLKSNDCGHAFYIDHSTGPMNLKCRVCYPTESAPHIRILNKLRTKFPSYDIVSNFRPKWLNGQELDIFIKDVNIAIEINGLYWHSIKAGKCKDYHLRKTEICEENGVELIHLFEDEIDDYHINMIIDKINGYSESDLSNMDVIDLTITKNIINKGLFSNNKLIASLLIDITNGSNIQSFVTISGYRSSAVLARLLTNVQKPIVAIIDRRFTPIANKSIYIEAGFTLQNISSPRLWKFNKDEKRQLIDAKEISNINTTGYNAIYDCGTFTFELT